MRIFKNGYQKGISKQEVRQKWNLQKRKQVAHNKRVFQKQEETQKGLLLIKKRGQPGK